MRRLLSLAILLAFSLGICNSQVIKEVEVDYLGTLAGRIPVQQRYQIDSLVISGYLHTEDFATLRNMIGNGRLRGIDMSEAQIDVIPEGAFASSKVNATASSDGGDGMLTNLEYVTLPKDLRWIADRAFLMTALRCVSIPRVSSIGSGAFAGCPNLREVQVHQVDLPRMSDDTFGNLPDDATLLVPTGTAEMFRTSVGFSSFKRIEERGGLFRMLSFTVGEGLPTLAEYLGDDILTVDSLTLSGYLTEADFAPIRIGCAIGRLSGIDMSGCQLEKDSLVDGIFECREDDPYYPSIPIYTRHLFPYYLRHIRLPKDLKVIGWHAFYWTKLCSLEIPPTVTKIGEGAFFQSEIGSDVRIPEGMKELKRRLFYESWIKGDIYLPSTLERVYEECFTPSSSHKDAKQNFFYNRLTPPETVNVSTKSGPFGIYYKRIPTGWTLYVPVGAKAAFEADEYWGKFQNIVETPELDGGQSSGIKAAVTESDGSVKTTAIYSLDGRYLGTSESKLPHGIYIVGGKKVVR